jgi:hypothetical protein
VIPFEYGHGEFRSRPKWLILIHNRKANVYGSTDTALRYPRPSHVTQDARARLLVPHDGRKRTRLRRGGYICAYQRRTLGQVYRRLCEGSVRLQWYVTLCRIHSH